MLFAKCFTINNSEIDCNRLPLKIDMCLFYKSKYQNGNKSENAMIIKNVNINSKHYMIIKNNHFI